MVSFKRGKEIVKHVSSSCHERGTEKILGPHEELNLRPRSDALQLSHRDSTTSAVYYEVHLLTYFGGYTTR